MATYDGPFDLDRDDAITAIIAAGGAVVFSAIIIWLAGASLSLTEWFVAFVIFVVMAFATRQSGDYSIGFVLISLGFLLVIAEYLLPQSLIEPFTFFDAIFKSVVGFSFAQVDPWQFLLLAVLFVFVTIMARVRFTSSGAKYIDRVFDNTAKEFGKYVSTWVTIGRLTVVLLLAMVTIVLTQMGELAANVGDVLMQAPFIASNLFTILAGYVALGGDIIIVDGVPLLGNLSALDFLVFTLIALALAAMTKFESSGPLARFLR